VQDPGPLRENVEVHGSHSGLGFNPAVLMCLADRLHQREDTWAPFKPALGLRPLFGKLSAEATT
jgi:hypothetical protein